MQGDKKVVQEQMAQGDKEAEAINASRVGYARGQPGQPANVPVLSANAADCAVCPTLQHTRLKSHPSLQVSSTHNLPAAACLLLPPLSTGQGRS